MDQAGHRSRRPGARAADVALGALVFAVFAAAITANPGAAEAPATPAYLFALGFGR